MDVGGGHGVLMRAVLEAQPHMRGVVLDLPGVIESARLADAGLTDRCEAIAGDFFEAVPAGGDAYVLSWILHDWDDQSAVRILANCRAAIGDAGRLLTIELVVLADDESPSSPRWSRSSRQQTLRCSRSSAAGSAPLRSTESSTLASNSTASSLSSPWPGA